MKTISCTDIIFARVSQCGRMVASLCLSGITSIQELYQRISERLGGHVGLITVQLRNGSQGWTDRRHVLI